MPQLKRPPHGTPIEKFFHAMYPPPLPKVLFFQRPETAGSADETALFGDHSPPRLQFDDLGGGDSGRGFGWG